MNKENKPSLQSSLKCIPKTLNKLMFQKRHNNKIYSGIGLILFVLTVVIKLKKNELIFVLLSIGFVIVTDWVSNTIARLKNSFQPQ